MDDQERAAQGMAVRRAVLGDAHVDRAEQNKTEFTQPFQDFITRYAWGEIWSRPGLTKPERSIVTLTVLAALQHEGELAMHVKAALLAEELDLANPPLPWHTERLRIIDVAGALARVTAATGRIARDVTLLAQTEVGEVSEGPADNSKKKEGPSAKDAQGTSSTQGTSSPQGTSGASGGAPRRGGSSAMPHKNNPVASVAILGCARQVPGLLATLVASAEQEHQRAAGAWHAEWQPFTDILNLASSAAAWTRELLGGLRVDTGRMAANLAAAGGLPLAERVTALLSATLGGPKAHDLVATAAAKAVSSGLPLRDVLLSDPEITATSVSARQIEEALDPAGYLGSAGWFVTAALRAHRSS